MENKLNKTGKVDRNHPAFRENAKPFFSIMYNVPGFTNKIEGRKAYMDWFEGYSMELKYADNLRVYKDIEQGVITLEYQVHGTSPYSQKLYDNRFCSIVTIKDRKIVHWRDYADSLAMMS